MVPPFPPPRSPKQVIDGVIDMSLKGYSGGSPGIAAAAAPNVGQVKGGGGGGGAGGHGCGQNAGYVNDVINGVDGAGSGSFTFGVGGHGGSGSLNGGGGGAGYGACMRACGRALQRQTCVVIAI